MKHTLILLALILSHYFVQSQDYKIVRKVIPVLSEQSFYLNGGIRSSFGGKSRVYYKIDLPPNTIEWAYSFTTSKSDQGTANLKLAAQMTRIIDPTGGIAMATETLLAPSGVASADIFLCDKANANLFMQKTEVADKSFQYKISGSRQNYTHGVVPIKIEKQGTWFLVIRNPSEVDGINVNLEVAAVVEERVPIAKTDAQTKAELYGNLGWQSYLAQDYDKCIELSKKALALEANLPWVKCNLSLCYLVQNKKEYLDSYIDAITACKKTNRSKEYLQAALKDLNDAMQKTTLPNANEIIALLKQELSSFN